MGGSRIARRASGRAVGTGCGRPRRARLLTSLAAGGLVLVGVPLVAAGPAEATGGSVSSVMVTQTTPVTDAPSDYSVTLVVSPTGGMAANAGNTVTLTFLNGVNLGFLTSGIIADQTTSVVLGKCGPNAAAEMVTCTIDDGNPVNDNDKILVTLDGVINHPNVNTDDTVQVETTADNAGPVTSNRYPITAAQQVSNVTVSQTVPETNASSDYTVTFDASSTGGMVYNAGDTVTIGFPSGTNLSHVHNGTLVDATTEQILGNCVTSFTSTETCDVNNGQNSNAGDAISADLFGVVNPATGGPNETVSVLTSVDNGGAASSNAFAITAANEVSNVTVAQSVTSATNGVATYTAGFTASDVGGVAPGGTYSITFPDGTNVSNAKVVATDTTTNETLTSGGCAGGGSTVTCPVGQPINASDIVSVVLYGVVNPAAPSTGDTVSVQTSTDDGAVIASSNTFGVTAAQQVSGVTVAQDDTPAAAGFGDYAVTLTTSTTGGLAPAPPGFALPGGISFSFPVGTNLRNAGLIEQDTTTNEAVYDGACTSSTDAVTCGVTGPVNAGDTVRATFVNVGNPSTTSAGDTVGVSTSSDTGGAVSSSDTYAIDAAQAVSAGSVAVSNPAVDATGVSYSVGFTASSTGEMPATPGFTNSGTYMFTFPTGTDLSAASVEVRDASTGDNVVSASCGPFNTVTAMCGIGGAGIGAGNTLVAEFTGVTNPGSSTYRVIVATTSDTTPAPSESYVIGTGVPTPMVDLLAPAQGPVAGGNQLTIDGSDLLGASGVMFGSVPGTNISVNGSGTQMTVTAPHDAGTAPNAVDVTVMTPGGTSATSSSDRYDYLPLPKVTSLTPTSGTAAGGQSVTIKGTGFFGTNVGVTFGSGDAAVQSINAAGTAIIVQTPPSPKTGKVALSVTTGGGTATKASAYTYLTIKTVTKVTAVPQNPVFGEPVTLTATVNPTPDGGTVQFVVSGTKAGGAVTLSGGTASTTVANLTVGSHTVEAEYSGLVPFGKSTGTLSEKIGKAGTTVTAQAAVLASGSTPSYTMDATLKSNVTGAGIVGRSLVFKADATTLCTATTGAGGVAVCTASTATKVRAMQLAGGYNVSFTGSTDYAASSASAGLFN
ncbi:MAG TPA: IPT/TIG domain-containing protein [Acidimicrobiales bacterium]|nr:IPT/TIG domain-containing protein [Acidimicrobiales bacterium]